MKEMKNQKSLYWKILRMSVIPIMLLAIVITSFSAHSFSKALSEEVKKGLVDISGTILTVYDHLYPGDYRAVKQDGALYMLKGEHQLNGDYRIIDDIKAKTGVEITFFYRDTRVITTIYQDADRIVGTGVNAVVSKDVIKEGNSVFYEGVEIEEELHFAYYTPILNSDGNCIGMLSVAKPTKEVVASKMKSILPIFMLGFIGMVIAGFFSLRFARDLIDGIAKIEQFLRKVAKGNLNDDLDYAVSKREDELGNMARNAVKMQKSLIELIEKDALTGLYNRRSADKKLKEAYRNKTAKNINMQLVIGDIDYFKAVNDTYGHECGDVVLSGVSDIIKNHIRGKGFAARWGGEEFLLVYIDMDYEEVFNHVQNLLDEVRETEIVYNEERIRVTLTFGINKDAIEGVEEMLREADEKLYEGKKNGRNRIV